MKSCINCGTGAPDDAASCAVCGRPFSFVSGDGVETIAIDEAHQSARPDGSGPSNWGAGLVVIGLLFVLISFALDTEDLWGIDPEALAMSWALTLLGGAAMHLGIILWLAGYIVRAISFLPEEKGDE